MFDLIAVVNAYILQLPCVLHPTSALYGLGCKLFGWDRVLLTGLDMPDYCVYHERECLERTMELDTDIFQLF